MTIRAIAVTKHRKVNRHRGFVVAVSGEGFEVGDRLVFDSIKSINAITNNQFGSVSDFCGCIKTVWAPK